MSHIGYADVASHPSVFQELYIRCAKKLNINCIIYIQNVRLKKASWMTKGRQANASHPAGFHKLYTRCNETLCRNNFISVSVI